MVMLLRPTFDDIRTKVLDACGSPQSLEYAPLKFYTALDRLLNRLEGHPLVMRPHLVIAEPLSSQVRIWWHPRLTIDSEQVNDPYVVHMELSLEPDDVLNVRLVRGHAVPDRGLMTKTTDYNETEWKTPQRTVDAAFSHLRVLFGPPM